MNILVFTSSRGNSVRPNYNQQRAHLTFRPHCFSFIINRDQRDWLRALPEVP